MAKEHTPVAYKVWVDIRHGDVRINPPVLCDYQPPGGETENTIILTNGYGEVEHIYTRGQAEEAIHDFCMTHENVGKGDTFTFRGESQPALIIRDFEVERY